MKFGKRYFVNPQKYNYTTRTFMGVWVVVGGGGGVAKRHSLTLFWAV